MNNLVDDNVKESTDNNHHSFGGGLLPTDIDLSYLRPVKRKQVRELFDGFCFKSELKSPTYEDVLILPGKDNKGGCVDRDGKMIEESKTLWFGGSYAPEKPLEITYDNRKVAFLGEYADGCFGHIFTDLVSRAWYCLDHDSSVDAYVIISRFPGQKYKQENLNEIIRLLGIRSKLIFLDKPTRFREVVIPELSFTNRYYTEQFTKTIDFIKKQAICESSTTCKTPDRVFLSRSRFKRAQHAEGGLELLDDYFEKNGFTIIYPEEKRITEIINIMHNASVCASESGSVAFNTLFGSGDLDVIVIERLSSYSNGNLVTNLSGAKRITYVDGHYTIYPTNAGGACILGFTEEFERFTRDNGYNYPSDVFTSPEYLKESFETYCRHYVERDGFKLFLNDKKSFWLPSLLEALDASVALFPWLDKDEIIEKYYKNNDR